MPRTKKPEPAPIQKSTPVKKAAGKKPAVSQKEIKEAPTKQRISHKQKNEALKLKLQALLDEI